MFNNHRTIMASPAPILATILLLLVWIFSSVTSLQTNEYTWGPFNSSYYDVFKVVPPATISNGALQITPDSAGNFSLTNRSGRVFFNQGFKLWDEDEGQGNVASFNTSFDINIYWMNQSSPPGEGFAFLIAPDTSLPLASDGQYLGLTNSTIDGNPNNHFVAVEFDTFKQDFDPDDNHVGLDINSIKSNKTVSLSKLGLQIAPKEAENYTVWVDYDGQKKILDVYLVKQGETKPAVPLLSSDLDLKDIVKQESYFGFAASTGTTIQLNCVLGWNLTVEVLPGSGSGGNAVDHNGVKIGLGIGVPSLLLIVIGVAGFTYWVYKKRKAASDPNILGALKSLPGTPREFSFKDLKKATNNFDDKHKLGQGGFGVVYKGVLPKEDMEVAVKKFSRDSIKSKDDFLAELTIINRLRHKHLVRLQGWCHQKDILLLVYDYMPNGSLDNHLFNGNKLLGWKLRYKIVSGIAYALHYLHNEYDQKVVHRDLKASNIMLDSNFNARLGDFGLARALEIEKSSYVELEGVPGTIGYIAPECFHTGKATCESDVYGFGAVLLEVVCGQRPWTKIAGFQFLVDWVWWLHRERRLLDAVDERLRLVNDCTAEEAERLLLLGLACSHPIASERPKTHTIVQIISGSVAVGQVPSFKPAFVWPSAGGPNSGTTEDISAITASTTSSWTPQCVSTESHSGGYNYNSLL
ncbi:probable L-type lectin-domain containing receptor kinase S.5 [Tripterygium wilfordii]|nr:probable L-type lectin-domain containing receptor kinase S.5 [Tripterygium wilfordii]